MTAYRAAWVCPIDRAPLRDGWVAVQDERIIGVGQGQAPAGARDLGCVALLPGLINAHIHLELSWLRGRVPPAATFTDWVKQLIAARGGVERGDDPAIVAPIVEALSEVRRCGTVAVGEISNSLASVAPIAAAGLEAVVFHELLGFTERDGALIEGSLQARRAMDGVGVRLSAAPHAPYSTSPELFRAIRASVSASACPITSVHLGESPQETELLAAGTGPWRRMLELIGAWRDDWPIPGCDPVEYLDRMQFIDAQTLVVHGVQLGDDALRRLAEIGATLVTCPRSNQWVGVGAPPVGRFYAAGVAVAVGTDSLASVPDLNLFSELEELRRLAPDVPARRILESATRVGAQALGLANDFGTLSVGRRAEMIAVGLPASVNDVEEHLLSGVRPDRITWVVPEGRRPKSDG